MQNVVQKAVSWVVGQVDAHVERQVELRVYGDRRADFGLQH